MAQDATPPVADQADDLQARLDALDPDTRDNLARALSVLELRADLLTPDQARAILGAKNSNEAFGQRMSQRLIELAIDPPSFVANADASAMPRYSRMPRHFRRIRPTR